MTLPKTVWQEILCSLSGYKSAEKFILIRHLLVTMSLAVLGTAMSGDEHHKALRKLLPCASAKLGSGYCGC